GGGEGWGRGELGVMVCDQTIQVARDIVETRKLLPEASQRPVEECSRAPRMEPHTNYVNHAGRPHNNRPAHLPYDHRQWLQLPFALGRSPERIPEVEDQPHPSVGQNWLTFERRGIRT